MFVSISLIGIVFTQLFWVKKSIYLKKEQFDNSIRIAIKSVLNQLQERKSDSTFLLTLKKLRCRKGHIEITDIINPKLLDSLLKEELGCMAINHAYYYGIYNDPTGRFVMGHYHSFKKFVINSPYQFSISAIYRPGNYYLGFYFPGKTSLLVWQMKAWLILSVFFLISLISSFIYVVSILLKQKKISEMKNDFINNMTHELKTPIATSSLAAEMLLKPHILYDTKRITKYAEVIIYENQRLEKLVEQVLQISVIEKNSETFKFKKTDVHILLDTVIESMELRLKEGNIRLEYKLGASYSMVWVDKIHMMNVFYNLMDNAIKYSPENPKIAVETSNTKQGVFIRVSDNGIGISQGHQKHIFENLYRVPKGNIHEVHGFGLGLYYVKTVIEHHKGTITVKSEPGKGTQFEIYLPFKTESNDNNTNES